MFTPCWYDPGWLSPCPSETVTWIVQLCWLPVVFGEAVQVVLAEFGALIEAARAVARAVGRSIPSAALAPVR